MERKTGIVRRIDDLGRVVIPKEIRRKLNIHEGDPLEITYTNDGGVFFRKYLTDEEKRKNWVNEMLFEKKRNGRISLYFFSKIYPKYYHFNNGIVDFPKSLHFMCDLFPAR